MKKLLTVFGVLLGCSSVFCHAAEDNKMKMVTYFPVPYVAYSQVQVSDQMDVGLNASCQLNLGCLENTSSSLDAKRVNLKKGKLFLLREGSVSGDLTNERTSIGLGNGAAEVDFDRLSVGTLNNGLSIQADTFSPSTLNLFPAQAGKGSSFPACSGRTISWQKLKLKDKEEVYLVCGAPEQLPCPPTNNGKTTYTESCGTGYTGSITYTWNTSTCKYDKKDTCKAVEPESFTCVTGVQWYETTNGVGNLGCEGTSAAVLEPEWRVTGYATTMVCPGETAHHSGTVSPPFGAKWDCVPGQYYLYNMTYGFVPTGKPSMTGNCTYKYGYWCLKCGTVTSATQCYSKAPTLNSMGCHGTGSSGGGYVTPTPMPSNPELAK